MRARDFFILLCLGLLALEPALPPAPMGRVQPQDLGVCPSVKGLCGLPACRPHKPSLCGGPLAAGLYASGCVPVNRGFYAPPATAKWAPAQVPGLGPAPSGFPAFTFPGRSIARGEPSSPPPRA